MARPLTRVLTLLVSLAAVLMVGLGTAGTATAAPQESLDPAPVPVEGTLADGTGSVDGTFDVQRFTTQDGQLLAVGTFTGTVENEAGEVLQSGTQQVALPVDTAASGGTCDVLNLQLAPLDLDLLGLQVHLDQVNLDIAAEPGAGNLVGNLLCAVAGLLDGPGGLSGLLDEVASLLNQLLGALR